MKKMILICISTFIFSSSYSQTEKGKKLLGGSINFYGSSDKNSVSPGEYDSDELGFFLASRYGYFVKNQLAIGATLRFGTYNYKYSMYNPQIIPYPSTNERNEISFGVGGFIRSYKNFTEKFSFIVDGSVYYNYSDSKSIQPNAFEPDETKTKTNGFSFILTPGINYFLTSKLGIEASLGNLFYSYSKSKDDSSPQRIYKSSDYGIRLNGSTILLGLTYYF